MAETEGASLAASHGIGFCEVSVADNTPSLYKAFERLLNDSKGRPVKQRKFSVSKMIGNYYYCSNLIRKKMKFKEFSPPEEKCAFSSPIANR